MAISRLARSARRSLRDPPDFPHVDARLPPGRASAWYGRGSTVNKRRSPLLTSLPSLEMNLVEIPAHTRFDLDCFDDSNRPMNSSHSTTSRSTGRTTETVGAGGVVGCGCFPHAANSNVGMSVAKRRVLLSCQPLLSLRAGANPPKPSAQVGRHFPELMGGVCIAAPPGCPHPRARGRSDSGQHNPAPRHRVACLRGKRSSVE